MAASLLESSSIHVRPPATWHRPGSLRQSVGLKYKLSLRGRSHVAVQSSKPINVIKSSSSILPFDEPSHFKTEKVVFEDAFLASDSATLEQLRELTALRSTVEGSLDDKRKLPDAIARQIYGGASSPTLQKLFSVEQYLPTLEGFVEEMEKKENKSRFREWTRNLQLTWSSPLIKPSLFGGPHYFEVPDLRFEQGMILALYGSLLRRHGLELLPKGDMAESARFLRQAAGVYSHSAENILSVLEPPILPQEKRPPEVHPKMAKAWSTICLAEAQAVTAFKALEKGTRAGLLSKLHYGVVELLDGAQKLVKTNEKWELTPKFTAYLGSSRSLHEQFSYRFLASQYETEERIGTSVGLLRQASLRFQHSKLSGDSSWKEILERESSLLGKQLTKYETENDCVWRDIVPETEKLPRLEGKLLVSSIPYQPSEPKTLNLMFTVR